VKRFMARGRKFLGMALILLMLLPVGVSLAQPKRDLKVEKGKAFAPERRPGRPDRFLRELRSLREEIIDKILILREEAREIKEALRENPNPPEDFKRFVRKAREHALKARSLLKEVREKLRDLREERRNLKREEDRSANLPPRRKGIRSELIQIRNLLKKASHELDLAIFFAEKALETLGR
jgi:DNA repair exonuclease SbcCD ATPase subunit